MSTQSVETILSRAMSDAKFADSLFANPELALTGYDLSVDESNVLRGTTRADFAEFTKTLPEERKSFRIATNHNETALRVR